MYLLWTKLGIDEVKRERTGMWAFITGLLDRAERGINSGEDVVWRWGGRKEKGRTDRERRAGGDGGMSAHGVQKGVLP